MLVVAFSMVMTDSILLRVDMLDNVLWGGLSGALVGALAGGVAGGPHLSPRSIVVVETIRWVWRNALRAALGGLMTGVIIGMGYHLATMLSGRPNDLTDSMLFAGVFAGLVGGLGGGFAGSQVDTNMLPNQGIRRSARSAFLGGLSVGVAVILAIIVINAPYQNSYQFRDIVSNNLPPTLIGISIGALAYGGYACLSHLALRLVLWQRGYLPWNIARFLDVCADHILMQKVGGGYIFIHRLLLEYFATLDAPEKASPPQQHWTGTAAPEQ